MRRYEVVINGNRTEAQATRAAVAVNRAMNRFAESEFQPAATLVVRCLDRVKYRYAVFANVPFVQNVGTDVG